MDVLRWMACTKPSLAVRALPGDPKTYRLMGSTDQLRGHNLLFCRAWGSQVMLWGLWLKVSVVSCKCSYTLYSGAYITLLITTHEPLSGGLWLKVSVVS